MSDRINNFINNSIISGACIGGAFGFIAVGPSVAIPLAFLGGTVAGAVAGAFVLVAGAVAGAFVLVAGAVVLVGGALVHGVRKVAECIDYNNFPFTASCSCPQARQIIATNKTL